MHAGLCLLKPGEAFDNMPNVLLMCCFFLPEQRSAPTRDTLVRHVRPPLVASPADVCEADEFHSKILLRKLSCCVIHMHDGRAHVLQLRCGFITSISLVWLNTTFNMKRRTRARRPHHTSTSKSHAHRHVTPGFQVLLQARQKHSDQSAKAESHPGPVFSNGSGNPSGTQCRSTLSMYASSEGSPQP